MALTDQITSREPIESDGNSGNPIERVTLADGRVLVHKRVSPEWDWMARLAHDRGRVGDLWQRGFFERVPPSIDHTIVGAEEVDGCWHIFMRDVAERLVPGDRRIDRGSVDQILSAMHDLHERFWGERFGDLCSLEDRYTMFSPVTMRRERELGNHHGELISRGWDAFVELASPDVGAAVVAIADRPRALAERLSRFEHTVIHGDLRVGNLGFDDDRLVVIDWGERVGTAPPAVELAWLLGFDSYRLDSSPDEVVASFRDRYGARCEDEALQLALIGGLVQLGGIMSLWVRIASGQDERRVYEDQLSWWDTTVARALERCGPI